jgi:3-hydroxy-9,10-secoandrosta-1,3,5(10)-triene-9,17-dione monooxygenase reductase component
MGATGSRQIDAQTFRRVMGSFATGVTVVTTQRGDEWHGMTANSFTSVSLDPLLILVCFVRDSRTAEAVIESGVFALDILNHAQMDLWITFAAAGDADINDVTVGVTSRGVPILRGSLGYLECDVDAVHDGGDHIIVVGEVVDCEAREGEPLVFLRGKYARSIDYDAYPVPNWWG